jgi:cysteine desulfurase
MIYLDHHATTPLCKPAADAIANALSLTGNGSSIHQQGRMVRASIERARASIATTVGALARELVFTSGGTEAVHLAVNGVGYSEQVAHILLDRGAHPALESACALLAATRNIPLQFIDATAFGTIDRDALRRALASKPAKTLVAASWVQHETGAIAPIASLAQLCHHTGALLVVDAVQAVGKVAVDFAACGAAAAAISAHKIGGPAGVGAAWIRHDVRARATVTGGSQERGLRAGTENHLGIVGFAAATSTVASRLQKQRELAEWRDQLARSLNDELFHLTPFDPAARASTVLHGSLHDIAGEELVAALDVEGLCVSAGPACSSGKSGPSTAMERMFTSQPWRARGAVRISLGYETTASEIEQAAQITRAVLARFASLSHSPRPRL